MTEQTTPHTHPQLVAIEQVSDGWIKKYLLTYQHQDGKTFTYESVSRKDLAGYTEQLERNAAGLPPKPDAVCIYPILSNDSILLIREFRYPLNSWVVGLPAGLVEPGEDLAVAVDRELREETGYPAQVHKKMPNPLLCLPESMQEASVSPPLPPK